MGVEIPDKLYFKIGEVSKLACVAPHVLRYWESEFTEIQPQRAQSNQRLYRHDDVKIVLLIKNLLHEEGYTLSGAKKFLIEQTQVQKLPIKTRPVEYLGLIKEELLAVRELLNKKE